jgi:uncharacterized protein YbbK (DUF523 family)
MRIIPVRYAIACYRVSGDQMESILISACLLGTPVRYNGGDKRCDHEILQRWFREGRLVPVCPEVDGGLPVPRLPAEIDQAAVGLDVLADAAKVIDSTGRDVSTYFVKGAEHVLACARSKNIRLAVLKEGSPSCGTGYTYDGTFTGRKVFRPGVTTALLQQSGIRVFSEAQLEEADNLLRQFEASA